MRLALDVVLGLLFGLFLMAMTALLLVGHDAGDVHGTTTTTAQ